MIWATVMPEVVRMLDTDTKMLSFLGGPHIYRNRTRATIQVPSVAYTVVSEIVTENYAPCVVQFDIWANTAELLADIQLRIFQILHHDLPVKYGELDTWSQYENSFEFNEEDQSVLHRAVAYRFTPARLNG